MKNEFYSFLIGIVMGALLFNAFSIIEIGTNEKNKYYLPGDFISYEYGYHIEHGEIFGSIPNVGYEVITKNDTHVLIKYNNIIGRIVNKNNKEILVIE